MQNHKLLVIGDLHVKKDNIAESNRFIEWIAGVISTSKVSKVLFMGDQYNDMGVVSAEVLDFWESAFSRLASLCEVYALIGNHDVAGDGITSPMLVHKSITAIGQTPVQIAPGMYGLGFIRKEPDFLAALKALPQKADVLFCHQEFEGSQYENGFYAPHGFRVDAVLPMACTVVCGHIHKSQSVGPVTYIGTPRHLTRSDIGEVKGVRLFDGAAWQFLPTPESVCEPFKLIQVSNEEDLAAAKRLKSSSKVFVEIVGDANFIKKASKDLPEGFNVRSIPVSQTAACAVKESDGIPQAFQKSIQIYRAKNENTSNINELLPKVLQEIYSCCPMLRS